MALATSVGCDTAPRDGADAFTGSCCDEACGVVAVGGCVLSAWCFSAPTVVAVAAAFAAGDIALSGCALSGLCFSGAREPVAAALAAFSRDAAGGIALSG